MYSDHLEQLVLSGELFNGPSRSSSPARSPSPSDWPQLSEDEDPKPIAPAPQDESIGMGPGRTGVKGVIRDRDEAVARTRERQAREAADLARAMERASLGGTAFREEARAVPARAGGGRFGYLREVGEKGYVGAIEGEDRRTWVVVHIYDASLDRCGALDDTLCRLARLHPQTKFIRVRAGAIGFASTATRRPRAPSSSYLARSRTAPRRYTDDDDDDPYGDDEKQDVEEDDEEDEDSVDTDMLPTMLVYRGGELVHNWVRVDWEAGAAGVEDLLERHQVIEPLHIGSDNLSFPLDDGDDDLGPIVSELAF